MRMYLEIVTGPFTDRKIELKPCQTIRVGRSERADVAMSNDAYLSSRHFALECDDNGCRIRDLESTHGTFVNRKRVHEARLADGDEITAGDTIFVVRLENEHQRIDTAASQEDFVPTIPEEKLFALLRGRFQPLYAILDTARDPKILNLLKNSGAEYQSLYEGVQAQVLDEYAPYLVRLPADSRLLEQVVQEGWSKSWGIYLTCRKPFKEVRKHLRHFLLVKSPENEDLYFRFYDPRVLRVFLPTCAAGEAAEFFGPVSYYLVESESGARLAKFARGVSGATQEVLLVADQPTADREDHLSALFDPPINEEDQWSSASVGSQFPASFPKERLVIRGSQMDFLAACRRLDFEKRLFVRLRQASPTTGTAPTDQALRELIVHGIERAASYDILLESDIAQFVSLAETLGENFDQDTRKPWIQAILSQTNLDSDIRLSWICTALQRETEVAG